ncbi:unnamed protein product, partial [Mesorhabditis spiculigera]
MVGDGDDGATPKSRKRTLSSDTLPDAIVATEADLKAVVSQLPEADVKTARGVEGSSAETVEPANAVTASI